MEGSPTHKYVMVVFTDGLYMKARAAVLTHDELKQAALTVDGHEYTVEEEGDIVVCVSALFRQPRHSVTIISHILTRDYWEVLLGKPELEEVLSTDVVVRAVTDAEYMLPPEVYARVNTGAYEADHTVIFLAGDGR